MALACANPAGSAVRLGNLYTVVWEGHAFRTFGIDLVTYLIREGFVGGFWGRGKNFCFRNTNRKILNVYGIHLVCWGHFTLSIKEGSR